MKIIFGMLIAAMSFVLWGLVFCILPYWHPGISGVERSGETSFIMFVGLTLACSYQAYKSVDIVD